MSQQQCKYPDEIFVLLRGRHFPSDVTYQDTGHDPCALSRAIKELGWDFSRPQTGVGYVWLMTPYGLPATAGTQCHYAIEGDYKLSNFQHDKEVAQKSAPDSIIRTIRLQKIREY